MKKYNNFKIINEYDKFEFPNKKLEEILAEGIDKVEDKEVREMLKESLK